MRNIHLHIRLEYGEENVKEIWKFGKLLRLTFSSDLRKSCLKTGESMSPNKTSFCFWDSFKATLI